MGCEHVSFKTEDGKVVQAIICSRGRKPKFCSVPFCGKPSVALCDYPVERDGKETTCDSLMCAQHRHPVSGEIDRDWCEGHYNYEQRQKQRGGYAGEEQT